MLNIKLCAYVLIIYIIRTSINLLIKVDMCIYIDMDKNISIVIHIHANIYDVSVLDDVISVRDGYKQCDLSKDEILLTIEIIFTN